MSENKPKRHNLPSTSSSSGNGSDNGSKRNLVQKSHINPPEREIPDAATLRDQWRYAIKQYSKWYSHAWGTAILAGTAFFALGWIIKGENPIPSFRSNSDSNSNSDDPKPSHSQTH